MKRAALVSAAFVAIATWTGASRADEASGESQAPVTSETTTYAPPNRWLLGSGAAVFLGAYVPSIIVAAANNNSYDNMLYIPVVGPWVDLAKRPSCGTGFGQISCTTAEGWAALLIVDGVFQFVGASAFALGFVIPERRTHVVTAGSGAPRSAALHLVPAAIARDAYGVMAFGDF